MKKQDTEQIHSIRMLGPSGSLWEQLLRDERTLRQPLRYHQGSQHRSRQELLDET